MLVINCPNIVPLYFVEYFAGIVKKFYEFGCSKNASTYVDINDNAKLIITTLLERLLEKPEEKT